MTVYISFFLTKRILSHVEGRTRGTDYLLELRVGR